MAERDLDSELDRAWAGWLTALTDAGRLVSDGTLLPDAGPAELAESYLHIAEQSVLWLTWHLGHGDPTQPRFIRQNDFFTQWGGPNADNIYRHARIDPAGRYRIRGRMHSCQEWLLAVRVGNMHEEQRGTLAEISASELGVASGGEFELLLGGPPQRRGWLPIPEGARMIAVREYYYDWRPEEPATFTIERLDAPPGPPPRPTPDQVAAALTDATVQYSRAPHFWSRYLEDRRSEAPINEFIAPRREARGLAALQYAFCFFDLAPDEALLVEVDVPDARYWSFQLYALGTYHALDLGRVTSLNHSQLAQGPTGRVVAVVAHDDPGVANWLDTEGRRTAQLTFRCGWGEPTAPTARVVRVADLERELPPETPRVTAQQRMDQLAGRAEHLRWRWRT